MNSEEADFDQAISCFLSADLGFTCVEQIRRISVTPESAEAFVQVMISHLSKATTDPEDAFEAVLRGLECYADRSTSSACQLMSHLWVMASQRVGMHDVCDSIDLWLGSCSDELLLQHMAYIASTAASESVKRHFALLLADRT